MRDVRDLHPSFPGHEDRLRRLPIGESIDLGGMEFVCLEPVIFDLPSTRWGFDTGSRMLFPGDGFAYSRYHEDGHCGQVGGMLAISFLSARTWKSSSAPVSEACCQLVNHELNTRIATDDAIELGLSRTLQLVDHGGESSEADPPTLLTGGNAESRCQTRLPGSAAADKVHVLGRARFGSLAPARRSGILLRDDRANPADPFKERLPACRRSSSVYRMSRWHPRQSAWRQRAK